MSFSKGFKGTFEEVRKGLAGLAAEVRADDEKNNASENVKQQHGLQADAAVHGLEAVLARIPEKHNGFRGFNPKDGTPVDPAGDAVIAVTINGSAQDNGLSGYFGGGYTITPAE
jgi:hypothetical protein